MFIGQQSSTYIIIPAEDTDNQSWSETLAVSQLTNGQNAIISDGDEIQFVGATSLIRSAPSGGNTTTMQWGNVASVETFAAFLGNIAQSFLISYTGLTSSEVRQMLMQGDGTTLKVEFKSTDGGANVSSIEFNIIGSFVEIFNFKASDGTSNPTKNMTYSVPEADTGNDAILALRQFDEAYAATVANTIAITWQTVVLTGAPANRQVQVQITFTGLRTGGVREVGSGLARLCTGNDSCNFQTVNTDALGQIQIYSSNIANVAFRYTGTYS